MMNLREAAKAGRTKPWVVERHDNADGSIAYEIWTVDLTHRICRIVDNDNPCARSDAHHIADIHNTALPSQERQENADG